MTKIMIVDDNSKIRILVRTLLVKKGYKVVEAESGEECLKKLEMEKPDLILLDIMMSGIDGWEVCKKIKEDKDHRDIPIVMLTVRASEKDMTKSLEVGADGHIYKPFDVDDLITHIESHLEKSSS